MASSIIAAPTADLTNGCVAYGRLLTLGLQHVLVMYAGTVVVSLTVGGALHLSKEQLAFLINADLLAAGLATLTQAFGTQKFGTRIPAMMGAISASVGPMIAIGTDPSIGLLGVYGAVIAVGLFDIVVAPLMGCVLGPLPPVVTGAAITLTGMSLMDVGIDRAADGQPTMKTMVDGMLKTVPNPAHGNLSGLGIALAMLVIILLLTKYGRGLIGNIAVLLGIVIGTLIVMAFGKVSFAGIIEADWVAVITSLHFGMPTFHFGIIASMRTVMLITLVESTGIFLALVEITGKKPSTDDLIRGLRADGLDTVIDGVFNMLPYVSFLRNVGLMTVTGVRSRLVAAMGGVILIALGSFPKMAHTVASVPSLVLGGTGIVMFGMVAATGVHILGSIDFNKYRHNLFIMVISIGFGMIPMLAPTLFQYLPHWLEPVTHSGIVLGTLVAVILNLRYDGMQSIEYIMCDATVSTHGMEQLHERHCRA